MRCVSTSISAVPSTMSSEITPQLGRLFFETRARTSHRCLSASNSLVLAFTSSLRRRPLRSSPASATR
jgi:hypothetical protein